MPQATVQEQRVRVATLTVATGAAACAACCVLPIALPAVALAGMGSVFAWLARMSSWFTSLAIVATAGAWIWIVRQSIRCAKLAASTIAGAWVDRAAEARSVSFLSLDRVARLASTQEAGPVTWDVWMRKN